MTPKEWEKIQSAPDGILTDVEHYHPEFVHDESRFVGKMDSISFPRSESEVRDHLAEMCRTKTPVTVQGARTGLSGGAVPFGGHVLNLGRMHRILGLRYDEEQQTFFLTVEAGVYLRDQIWPATTSKEFDTADWSEESLTAPERFRSAGPYYFPPDPSEPTICIGGMVANNSSGARSFFYGPTRRWIERARIVLVDGSILELKRGRERASGRSFGVEADTGRVIEGALPMYEMPKVKNSAGYFVQDEMDLIDLFIGSEGTLGVFSEVELRLMPAPSAMTGMMLFLPSDDAALRLGRRLTARETKPVAIEFFDRHSVAFMREIREALEGNQMGHRVASGDLAALYVEHHGDDPGTVGAATKEVVENAAACGADEGLAWIESGEEAIRSFKQIKHIFAEMMNGRVAKQQEKEPRIRKLGTDLAVPDKEFENLTALCRDDLGEAGLDHLTFGHLGDNNLHVNIIARDFEEYERGRQTCLQWAQAAVRMGGTVSAEHGIGKAKRALLKAMFRPEHLSQMMAVKRTFDPDLLLNPGNMFDTP